MRPATSAASQFQCIPASYAPSVYRRPSEAYPWLSRLPPVPLLLLPSHTFIPPSRQFSTTSRAARNGLCPLPSPPHVFLLLTPSTSSHLHKMPSCIPGRVSRPQHRGERIYHHVITPSSLINAIPYSPSCHHLINIARSCFDDVNECSSAACAAVRFAILHPWHGFPALRTVRAWQCAEALQRYPLYPKFTSLLHLYLLLSPSPSTSLPGHDPRKRRLSPHPLSRPCPVGRAAVR